MHARRNNSAIAKPGNEADFVTWDIWGYFLKDRANTFFIPSFKCFFIALSAKFWCLPFGKWDFWLTLLRILLRSTGSIGGDPLNMVGFAEMTNYNRCLTPMKVAGSKVLPHLDAFIISIRCFCASLDMQIPHLLD